MRACCSGAACACGRPDCPVAACAWGPAASAATTGAHPPGCPPLRALRRTGHPVSQRTMFGQHTVEARPCRCVTKLAACRNARQRRAGGRTDDNWVLQSSTAGLTLTLATSWGSTELLSHLGFLRVRWPRSTMRSRTSCAAAGAPRAQVAGRAVEASKGGNPSTKMTDPIYVKRCGSQSGD